MALVACGGCPVPVSSSGTTAHHPISKKGPAPGVTASQPVEGLRKIFLQEDLFLLHRCTRKLVINVVSPETLAKFTLDDRAPCPRLFSLLKVPLRRLVLQLRDSPHVPPRVCQHHFPLQGRDLSRQAAL